MATKRTCTSLYRKDQQQLVPTDFLLIFFPTPFLCLQTKRQEGRLRSWMWSGEGLGSGTVSVLVRSGREKVTVGRVVRQENCNKTTTRCLANPVVNESGSLQHFFYALLIPWRDKRNAEPAARGAKHPVDPARCTASAAHDLILHPLTRDSPPVNGLGDGNALAKLWANREKKCNFCRRTQRQMAKNKNKTPCEGHGLVGPSHQ